MKNILITGASGFVGSCLFDYLSSLNYNVTGISRTTGDKRFKIADFTNSNDFCNILEDVDVLVHCAAITDSHMDEDTIRDINVFGAIKLAEAAAKFNVKRFIFLSSAKVHGESTSNSNPFNISDKLFPMDSYSKSKAEAELKLIKLGEQSDMEVVILRPPLIYGYGVKSNFLSLFNLVAKEYPLPFGLINKNKRSLISIDNLVHIIETCLHHRYAANQIFLVSDDDDISTFEMISLMAKVQEKRLLMIPIPIFLFELMGRLFKKEDTIEKLIGSLQLDISHTKSTLGWAPPYSMEQSFRNVIRTK